MELLVDPSEKCFLSRATAEKDRIEIVLRRENMPPIEFSGIPVGMRLKLRDVELKDANQIGLLEFLINDDEALPCAIDLSYQPDQEDLPFEPDKPAAERTYDIDADGFVKNPIEIQVIVPDFLKAECKLLFACVAGYWFYGFKIGGCIERERRVNTLRADGVADLRGSLLLLLDSISESLHKDKSRLAEFIEWKINAAIRAIDIKKADLAEAMAEPVHLPADFGEEVQHGDTEDTEKESEVNASTLRRSNASTPQEDSRAETQGRGEEPAQEPLVIKVKGMKRTELKAVLFHGGSDGLGYGYKYTCRVGNYEGSGASVGCPAPDRAGALGMLKDDFTCWLDDIEITGTADQKRAMERRIGIMREQVNAELDRLIAAAESETGHESRGTSDENGTEAEPVEFEEDQPRD